jgi:hypothetical protein
MEPSVKGSLMLGVVVSVRRHRNQGRIAAPQLAARLGPAALEAIDQKIEIARWYPANVFCELLDIDWEVGGGRDPDYMRAQGERTADRLFDSGMYQQLQYAESAERVQSRDRLVRRAKLITTITGTLYNFLEIEVRLGPDCLEIFYGNATAYSEALRYTTEGFMNRLNHRQGSPRRWSSERLSPDRLAFRLPLPARLAE